MIFILQLFKAYPNSVEEISEMIHNEKAKAECNYQTNPQVIFCYSFVITGWQELVVGRRIPRSLRSSDVWHSIGAQLCSAQLVSFEVEVDGL